MGDVAALATGGVTFRMKEGIPPYGLVDRIDGDPEMVLCVVGKPISTAKTISDPEIRGRVNAVGSECVMRMVESPSLPNLMRLSREFMQGINLADPAVESAVKAVEDAGGLASMAMLGGSVFALGDVDRIAGALRPHGVVHETKVDVAGPRILTV
jgi:pantoate kinase